MLIVLTGRWTKSEKKPCGVFLHHLTEGGTSQGSRSWRCLPGQVSAGLLSAAELLLYQKATGQDLLKGAVMDTRNRRCCVWVVCSCEVLWDGCVQRFIPILVVASKPVCHLLLIRPRTVSRVSVGLWVGCVTWEHKAGPRTQPCGAPLLRDNKVDSILMDPVCSVWNAPCWKAPAYTSAPESTKQKWGPSLWCLLLVFNLSRTKSFICPAIPPSRPTCHWVMEHLLMFLKGQQDEKETPRMLNTKPMVPDTPHPSLSALSNLLPPAIPPLNCGTSRLVYSGLIVTAAPK